MIEIVIDAADPATLQLWHAVAELTERLPAGWVLIGGLMVQLHAIEHGVVDVRPTRDIDVLGQARPRGALPAIDAALRNGGFDLHDPDLDGYGYRYERDGIVVDVLAPEGIKPPPMLGGGVTAVGVPGGTQAIMRAESVAVRIGERSFELRRPMLLGAILIKARSLMVHADPASQREDLLRLLSLVAEPRDMAPGLRDTESVLGFGKLGSGSTFRLRASSSRTYSAALSLLFVFSSATQTGPGPELQHSIEGRQLRARCGGLPTEGADSTADSGHASAGGCRAHVGVLARDSDGARPWGWMDARWAHRGPGMPGGRTGAPGRDR